MGIILLLLLCSVLLAAASQPVSPAVTGTGDLNQNGIQEEYCLKDHCLTVKEKSRLIWKSDRSMQIDSFQLGDIDNDGNPNLVISLWKKGSFGEHQPFWHTNKDHSYKNHLFVYQLRKDTLHQVWCSSNLDHPILSFEIQDANGDGKNELVTKEGRYQTISGVRYAADPKGETETTVWCWKEWGFQRLDPAV